LGRPWNVGAVAALDHAALDRFGILAGPRRCRILARGGEVVPGREGHERREVDPLRMADAGDERFEPGAALGKGEGAEVLVASARMS
jgi:hypothetical protein